MAQFLMANLPWLWTALLVAFLCVEACTMSLTTIWAAAACVPLVFISRSPLAFRWQLLIFLAITVALAASTRPFAVRRLKIGRERTNVDGMAGQEVLVVEDVKMFERGAAKARNGVIWTARSADGSEIPSGTVCTVSKVEGNTLEVVTKT